MEYEVGSIADLISGLHTPNRPRVQCRPATPIKRPPVKDETPRSTPRGNSRKPYVLPAELTHSINALKGQSNSKHDSCNKAKKTDHTKKNIENESRKRKILENQSEENPKDSEKKKKNDSKNKFENDVKINKKRKIDSDVNNDVNEKITKKKKKSKDSTLVNGDIENEFDNQKSTKENKKRKIRFSDQIEYCENDANEDTKENVDELPEEPTDFQKAAQRRIEKKMLKATKFEDDELTRTIFIGNIPVSILKGKYKKILKKKFMPYGEIESLRIRNVPVADLQTKPKVAFIEKSFHPERSTVTAYIKFKDIRSVKKALAENNTKIEDNHIRVDTCAGENKPTTDSRKTLFLGNLPFNVEEEKIRELFEKCGAISSVRVVRDKKTQIGKGFGFVNFEKSDGVELALAMSEEDLKIGNKVVRVKRYNLFGSKNDENSTKSNGIRSNHQNKYNNNKPEQRFNKKRDEHGNKIRKRNLLNKNGNNADKKIKSNVEIKENGEKSNKPSDHSYKGVVAKRKKKSTFNKDTFKKKKISKILTSH